MHSSACDHRVCCNIIHCPCLRILESRAHPAPCTQEHASVHVFGQSQQIREKGGRPAPESACKCRSSSSQKQQLKAQIIYLIHLFFPSLQENILNKSTQIRVQPHSAFLWHFPTHRGCICTCARGRLGTPQPVHATTRGEERAEENRC